jgi:hypothetical protein
MKQREVQDANNTRWTCVQALSSASAALNEAARTAAEHLEGDDGSVPVVCTPSGGAASVRIRQPGGWEDSASDEQLLAAIAAAEHS